MDKRLGRQIQTQYPKCPGCRQYYMDPGADEGTWKCRYCGVIFEDRMMTRMNEGPKRGIFSNRKADEYGELAGKYKNLVNERNKQDETIGQLLNAATELEARLNKQDKILQQLMTPSPAPPTPIPAAPPPLVPPKAPPDGGRRFMGAFASAYAQYRQENPGVKITIKDFADKFYNKEKEETGGI
jgi:ribosomal protein L37AE/L43A